MIALYTFSICLLFVNLAFCAIPLSLTPPQNASQPILESFVSFSIEFSSFPDFAGNSSSPNTFSYNLLTNLRQLQGSYPIIRVGGNTQDYATFNSTQTQALVGTFNFSRSADYPTTISIGPSYFDSYSTWPNVTFLHGFNLAKNGSVGYDTLVGEVPLVCKALDTIKLAYFQLGNEPDLYKTSSQGPVRPSWWNETDYVEEWLNKTRLIRQIVQQDCPDVITQGKFKFYAPSFGGAGNSLNLITTWNAGLDTDNDIAFIDSHNYIGGATQPGVTLQGTLMNHTSTVLSVSHHLNESRLLSGTGIPYILGETNSLYNEGAPGLSNSFGAALWGVDFNLYCAATGIRRTHMHQGTNYRYASWQPIQTINETLGTKAPYYGNIMVAAFLGDLTTSNVSIADIELGRTYQNAYAAYVDGRLARIAIVQMNEWNTTNGTAGTRPSESFTFQVPPTASGANIKGVSVQRLIANGSDAITGITFDGLSYNYELEQGKPVMLNNVTRGEVLQVAQNGVVSVDVPWSSAAILNLQW
ncbi:hypothetical protein LTR10_020781 [Elasticomyces elasticus]|uniref:Beta-glucuronidase C-terminal domain-containing protein n=1 Tax=Exophiala sideris TaxID=1016849 RepID=A0ABR0J6A4_9EURO|nr:hypothetical protein LTR10_020781 [Elasticomyces elasticus]KAK5028835.1 hypothetical protein LTS07_006214 [Exophiala sideris]KAK5035704.1 hypothetical protein LTR13_005833 [Exophiala sideris]KAK5057339.1 hypothetical protein LTR69_007378 [Exophiala sideris]KAK5181688.1 hypothetical protein LTR44_005888 [Eurotiomycetes sp. CCFEE 6388]